jgi:carbamoyl-phosphate synthase large subunit
MRSTGEVMGIGDDFGTAYHHAMIAEGSTLPRTGTVFFSVTDDDKEAILPAARQFAALGMQLAATRGTAAVIREAGLSCRVLNKVLEGRPHTVDALKNGEIQLVINTTGGDDVPESFSLRRTTLVERVPYFTTVSGALAAAHALSMAQANTAALRTRALQDYHKRPGRDPDSAPDFGAGYR